jgi:hypothetical protein
MDDADKKAQELLPCECDGFLFADGVKQKSHTVECPAYYRLAVAAALQEKDTELQAARLHYKVAEHEAEVFCKQRDEIEQTVKRLERELATVGGRRTTVIG